MLRVALLGLVASALVNALHVQVPLESGRHWRGDDIVHDGHHHAGWSFDAQPNPNSTDHLVFETVQSLLQHWPNTRMRKGHNIVPGIVPKGTLLYHGKSRKGYPLGPEWVAMDPELAYFFCWDSWSVIGLKDKNDCWYLTLATTRPLKVVHLDGSSGSKFTDGSVDAQDLFVWGESRPDRVLDEMNRIKDLCDWATEFGMDGIARMGPDFEIMLCDFTSGVREVSFVNLESVKHGFSFTTPTTFELMNAGSWHNRFPGETRIKLDLTRLVSFYDTKLVPSLVPIRAGQERWDHRLRNISNDDLVAVKSKVEALLTRPWGSSSGIDWKALMHVIVDRFAGRFELLRHLLNSPAAGPDEIVDLANKTQSQLRIMLTPYLLFSARPTDPSNKTELDWAIPTYKLCATTHTDFAKTELDSMTDSEKLILQAIRGTSLEICRVVTRMWAAGVYAGIDSSLNTKASLDIAEVTQVQRQWAEELDRLMTWLDWSVWVKCRPACGPEELCYLPTWPIGFPGSPLGLPEPTSNEWDRPQPKCVSRVGPYNLY